MSKCGWCGKVIDGVSPATVKQGAVMVGDGEDEREVVPALDAELCSVGCAWALAMEAHRVYGMTGKGLRFHLINEHGLVPGQAAGGMRRDCLIVKIAESLASLF